MISVKSDTQPVVILVAGATKSCGSRLTYEISPEVFKRRDSFENVPINLLERFLQENFHLATDAKAREQKDYPTLPLLLSLIDLGIEKRQPFRPLKGEEH